MVERDVLDLGADRRLRGAYQAVLLDAPCSGLGTLASRADLRWRRRPVDVARLAALQGRLLVGAAALVAPGGSLTYSVCTLTRAETLEVVERFLAGQGREAPSAVEPGAAAWELDDLGAAYPRTAIRETARSSRRCPRATRRADSSSRACGA